MGLRSCSYFTSEPLPTPPALLPRPKLRNTQQAPGVTELDAQPPIKTSTVEAEQQQGGGRVDGVPPQHATSMSKNGGGEDGSGRPAKRQRQDVPAAKGRGSGGSGPGSSCHPSDSIGKISSACSPPVKT